MLLRILPEQVSTLWDFIAPMIEDSLPPTVHGKRRRMANVLRAVLMEELVVWFYYDEKEEFIFLVGTTIEEDQVTLSKSLLIYCFSSLRDVSSKMFAVTLSSLEKYAKTQGCHGIRAYVSDPTIREVLKRFNFNTGYSLAEMEIL